MFNGDFYPTPRKVIEKMCAGLDLHTKTVLEPSAGSGNIIDYLQEQGAEVICCERDERLAKIAASKARMIKRDFMEVTSEEVSHVDFIIMNPPFTRDEHHIMHAFEIAPAGCQIIALCNSQTIEDGYRVRSRAIFRQKIKDYGFTENLGNCFDQAERSTHASISMVKLWKPGSNHDEEFADYFDLEEYQEKDGNGIMTYNEVRDIVNRYVAAVKEYDKVVATGVRMNALLDGFFGESLTFTCTDEKGVIAKDRFKVDLKKAAWKWIFSKMNMSKYVTKAVLEKVNRFAEQQQSVPFTMRNVYKMIEMIVATHGQRMDEALEEVFDSITRHHHENRYSVEGWKTNSHYLLGKKFIFPWMTEHGWSGEMSIRYNSGETLDDFGKALCYLTGTPFDKFKPLRMSVQEIKPSFGKWFDWGFFELRGYKKGTMHVKFKDSKTWEMVNRRIAEIKDYPLPEKV